MAEDDVEPSRKVVPAPKPVISRGGKTALIDSGYHGSQASIATEADEDGRNQETRKSSPINMTLDVERPTTRISTQSEERRTTEGSFQSAKEEQTLPIVVDIPMAHSSTTTQISHPEQRNVCVLESPSQSRTIRPTSSHRQSAEMTVPTPEPEHIAPQQSNQLTLKASETFEDIQSPSDGSSPIRPIVRKSSLNFASLPAREPLTATKKSFGNRISRTSHLEQSRTSYYGRHTGGKSFGNSRPGDDQDEDDEMDVDNPDRSELTRTEPDGKSKTTQMHNKTYTQRLQDQISMLGQSQSNAPRPSKSIPNIAAAASQSTYPVLPQESRKIPSPVHAGRPFVAPGAFPDDDEEDDWIGPPTVPDAAPSIFSPRPILPKSHSTDVMEGVLGKDSISGSDFNIPKTRVHDQRNQSPFREPTIPERTASILGQVKSVSTSVIRSPGKAEEQSEPPLKKGISVSNPNLASSRDDLQSTSPPKSPSRSYRDSPLKAAKDKLSSILKTSKGLFASSAAASAGAMASTLSPPPIRNSHHAGPSFEDVIHSHATNNGSLYPSLGAQGSSQSLAQPDSPSKKASTRKLKDKEAKEAQVMEDQMNKLGREREKEAEKARAFSQQERERVAAMEKQVAAQKEQERQTKAFAVSEPRATRSSPRKTKAQLEAEGRAAAAATSIDSVDNNVEMTDATSAMPPPVLPRLTAASQIGKAKEQAKRPTKPASQPLTKAKQAPVVIRVNTGFRAFQPSNAALAASLQESLPPPAPPAAQAPLRNKPSTKTLHPKQSTDSVRSFASSTTKVKALEAAARQREKVRFAFFFLRIYVLTYWRRTSAKRNESEKQSLNWLIILMQRKTPSGLSRKGSKLRERSRIDRLHRLPAHSLLQILSMSSHRITRCLQDLRSVESSARANLHNA